MNKKRSGFAICGALVAVLIIGGVGIALGWWS